MRLWYLWRIKVTGDGYDLYYEFVIRATSESAARKRAAKEDSTDSKIWLDPKTSGCERLMERGQAGIITENFQAG